MKLMDVKQILPAPGRHVLVFSATPGSAWPWFESTWEGLDDDGNPRWYGIDRDPIENVTLWTELPCLDSESDLESDKNSLSIESLNLSVRARRILQSNNIESVGHLCGHTALQLREFRNMGQTTINEIREKLSAIGMRLKYDPVEPNP